MFNFSIILICLGLFLIFLLGPILLFSKKTRSKKPFLFGSSIVVFGSFLAFKFDPIKADDEIRRQVNCEEIGKVYNSHSYYCPESMTPTDLAVAADKLGRISANKYLTVTDLYFFNDKKNAPKTTEQFNTMNEKLLFSVQSGTYTKNENNHTITFMCKKNRSNKLENCNDLLPKE